MRKYIVYKHTNKINGKCYIGITCRDIQDRWRDGKGYKRQKKFYNAILKYGWDSFSHEVLLDGLTREEACAAEIALIKSHDSILNGYNVRYGGDVIFRETSPRAEAVEKVDLGTGEIIGEYACIASAAEENDISPSNISMVCNGYIKSAGGFGWKRKGAPYKIPKGRTGTPKSKPVIQRTKSGGFIARYESIGEAYRKTGVKKVRIAECCSNSGNQNHFTAGGYKWEWG